MSDETLEDKLRYWRETKRAPGRLRRAGTSNTTVVIADDGEHRGKPAGTQTEHWNDRVDAHVVPPTVVIGKEQVNGS